MERHDPRRRRGTAGANVSQYLGHGLTMALSTLLFLLGGRQLDRWIGTEPFFTLVGAFVGGAAGFWSMYYHLVVKPRNERAEKGGGEGRGGRWP